MDPPCQKTPPVLRQGVPFAIPTRSPTGSIPNAILQSLDGDDVACLPYPSSFGLLSLLLMSIMCESQGYPKNTRSKHVLE